MGKENMLFLEHPMPGQKLRKFATPEAIAKAQEANSESGEYVTEAVEEEDADLHSADLITSAMVDSAMHRPVLDIDFGAQLIPSSTPGHFHLYLDKEVSWKSFQKVLKALSAAGLIEEGYAEASIQRGYSAVRLPWVEKPKPEEAPELDIEYLSPVQKGKTFAVDFSKEA